MPRTPRQYHERPESTRGSRAHDEEERRRREAHASSGEDPAEYTPSLIADTFQNMAYDAFGPTGEAIGDFSGAVYGAATDEDLGFGDMWDLLSDEEKSNITTEGAIAAGTAGVGAVAGPALRAIPRLGRALRRGGRVADDSSILPSLSPDDIDLERGRIPQRPRDAPDAPTTYDRNIPDEELADILENEWDTIDSLSPAEREIYERLVAGDVPEATRSSGYRLYSFPDPRIFRRPRLSESDRLMRQELNTTYGDWNEAIEAARESATGGKLPNAIDDQIQELFEANVTLEDFPHGRPEGTRVIPEDTRNWVQRMQGGPLPPGTAFEETRDVAIQQGVYDDATNRARAIRRYLESFKKGNPEFSHNVNTGLPPILESD